MKKPIFVFSIIIFLLLITGCNLNLKEKKLDFKCPDLKGERIKQATKQFLLTDSGNLYYFYAKYNDYESKEDFALFSNNTNCIKINGNTKVEKIEISNEEQCIFFVDSNQKYYIPINNDNNTAFESMASVDDMINDSKTMPYDDLASKYDNFFIAFNKYKLIQYLKTEKIINSSSIYLLYSYDQLNGLLYIKGNDIYRIILDEGEGIPISIQYGYQLGFKQEVIVATKTLINNHNTETPILRFLDTAYMLKDYKYEIKSDEIYFNLSEMLNPHEFVISMVKGESNLYYIKTNENYYILNVHAIKNKEACRKYTDVKCEYGVSVTKAEYASENYDLFVYISSHLFITKNGTFIIK